MTQDLSTGAPDAVLWKWSTFGQSLTRPYPMTAPMVAFLVLVPFYIFIPVLMPDRTPHAPELALDRALPLLPAWVLVYGSLYLFLLLLPVFVIRQEEHIRRTFLSYLTVWVIAYGWFVAYPTIAPRPARLTGQGFVMWGLRFLYSVDPPYNCFPSLHVAHSFVSALTCYRLHRGVGVAATICASFVAVSTLFAKQHYILDVIAGVLLACVAYAVFLRSCPRDGVPPSDRRAAPVVALGTLGVVGLAFACSWVAYQLSGSLWAVGQ